MSHFLYRKLILNNSVRTKWHRLAQSIVTESQSDIGRHTAGGGRKGKNGEGGRDRKRVNERGREK